MRNNLDERGFLPRRISGRPDGSHLCYLPSVLIVLSLRMVVVKYNLGVLIYAKDKDSLYSWTGVIE